MVLRLRGLERRVGLKIKAQQKLDDEVWRHFPLIEPERARQAVMLSQLSTRRLQAIAGYLQQTAKVAGDTAEIGLAGGGTTVLIALSNGGRRHWACDTFAGLQDAGEDDPGLVNGMFRKRVTQAAVNAALGGADNATIATGLFPDSAPAAMAAARFAFVHLDVDTYASTRDSFAFFESRMAPGGIMAIDDALTGRAPGAQKAWQEIVARNDGRWELIGETEQQAGIRFQ